MTHNRRLYGALLLILTLLAAGCRSDTEEHAVATQPPDSPVAVRLVDVTASEVADQVEIMATVQSARSAVISSRISGNITEMNVTAGSRVAEGETLLQLSAGEISAQLQQSKAQLDQARRNLKREQSLLAQKAATPEAVKALEESVRIAEAGYQEMQTMLGYTTITAPFDGLITRKLVEVGDLATPGKPLLHIENEADLQVVADVPESLIANIRLGKEMTISVPSARLEVVGKVVEIAPIADPMSRTVEIKLAIAENPALNSGQFARVVLPGATVRTILVPQESIHPFGQMERVFIVQDNVARLRLVRTGKRYGDRVEILSGLVPGDRLIVGEATGVSDGLPIRTI